MLKLLQMAGLILLTALPAAAAQSASTTDASPPAVRAPAAQASAGLQFEPAPVQPAPAAPRITGMTLERLVADAAWEAPVIAAAKAQLAEMPGGCPAAHIQPTGDLTVFQPAEFGADGKPFSGAWTESITVTGCSTLLHTLNVLTIAHAEGPPQRVALMPGTSHADPLTQKAALQYAQAVAGRAPPPGCRRQAFVEARFDKFTGPPNPEVTDGRDARPWAENWIVEACGSTYSINIRFKPNKQGTQLAASNPVKEH